VVLQPVSILHGGLAVNIVNEFQVSQPGRCRRNDADGAADAVEQRQAC